MKRHLLLAALLGLYVALVGTSLILLARKPSPDLSLWLECDDLPDPKGYIEATAPATREFPAVVHAYWTQDLYWLIRARPVDGGVFIEIEWPTKPGVQWKARLDWKGGPLEGKTQGWFTCP